MGRIGQAQLKTLLFLPCVMGPISILGSSLVLTCIFRHGKPRALRSVYHRLLAGLSVLDIVFSTATAMGPWPAPRPTAYDVIPIPWAQGTVPTCAAQGFFVQLGYLSYGYAMCVTIYYVLTIRYNVRERYIATYIEPFMHLSVWGFGLVTAVLNVVLEFANLGISGCWVSHYPAGCTGGDDTPYPCLRGANYRTFGAWVIIYPSFLFTAVTSTCLAMVIWTVWQRRNAARRFIFRGTTTSATTSTSIHVSATATSTGRRASLHRSASQTQAADATTRRMNVVVTQCLLYGTNFLVCNFWLSLQGMLVITDKPNILTTYFPVLVMRGIFFPLQGFFNALCFLRPRYLQWREREPDATRWWALQNAVWNPTLNVPTVRASRRQLANYYDSSESPPPRLSSNTGSSQLPLPEKENQVPGARVEEAVPEPKESTSSIDEPSETKSEEPEGTSKT